MTDYFFVHRRSLLEERLRPALAAAWSYRSFAPCRSLAELVAPLAEAYARRYHLGPAHRFLCLRLGEGLTFDRSIWRALVGELLVVAAEEVPEFPGSLQPLTDLLAPEAEPVFGGAPSPPFLQALYGSRHLTIGPVAYRPGHAGLNDSSDVRRIVSYLNSIDPARLAGSGAPPGGEAGEELLDALEALDFLRDLYGRACDSDRIVVAERLL